MKKKQPKRNEMKRTKQRIKSSHVVERSTCVCVRLHVICIELTVQRQYVCYHCIVQMPSPNTSFGVRDESRVERVKRIMLEANWSVQAAPVCVWVREKVNEFSLQRYTHTHIDAGKTKIIGVRNVQCNANVVHLSVLALQRFTTAKKINCY